MKCDDFLPAMETGGSLQRIRARIHAAWCPKCAAVLAAFAAVKRQLATPSAISLQMRQTWDKSLDEIAQEMSAQTQEVVVWDTDADRWGRRTSLPGLGFPVPDPSSDPISIVIGPPTNHRTGGRLPGALGYFSQVGPLSYLVSVALMCVAVLAAWQYKLADHADQSAIARNRRVLDEVVQHRNTSWPARVTGMEGCRWRLSASTEEVSDGSDLATDSSVSLGRQIRLDSGLFEITYRTGAKVLLQGPATFRVEANGGFLQAGKLTGRLENAEGGDSQSNVPNASHFAIHTPTAVVTDLGTEFGVEVDKDGATTAYVFRGSVQLHSTKASELADVVLEKNEAARVATDGDRAVIRPVSVESKRFARGIGGHRRVSLRVFDTGMHLGLGRPDPHWSVVAADNDPGFSPRAAAVLESLGSDWLPQSAHRSKWISLGGWPLRQPLKGTYTFRTTFDIESDQLPETAMLKGLFLVAKNIEAIRFNGENVEVPRHNREVTSELRTFVAEPAKNEFQQFTVSRGFVEGTNTLEIDVAGDSVFSSDVLWELGLRVVLTGSVQEKP
jgi:hypothetical protein